MKFTRKISSNLMTEIAIMFVLFSFLSCQKGEPGSVGPAGPAGPTGATGPTGLSGFSNIQSFVFTANSNNWVGSPGSGGTPGVWLYDISIPELTNPIYTNGLVLVYLYTPANDTETMLPFTQNGIDFFYISGILTPQNSGVPTASGLIQISVTMAGPFATVNPSSVAPYSFKVVLASQ